MPLAQSRVLRAASARHLRRAPGLLLRTLERRCEEFCHGDPERARDPNERVYGRVSAGFHPAHLPRVNAKALCELLLREALRSPQLANAASNVAAGALLVVHGSETVSRRCATKQAVSSLFSEAE